MCGYTSMFVHVSMYECQFMRLCMGVRFFVYADIR